MHSSRAQRWPTLVPPRRPLRASRNYRGKREPSRSGLGRHLHPVTWSDLPSVPQDYGPRGAPLLGLELFFQSLEPVPKRVYVAEAFDLLCAVGAVNNQHIIFSLVVIAGLKAKNLIAAFKYPQHG